MCNGTAGAPELGLPSVPSCARPPRNHLPEGIYHVTSRGVAGSSIFVDDVDRHAFMLLLQQVSELCGWTVPAWCLMGTHYHLLIDSRREQMSKPLHRLNWQVRATVQSTTGTSGPPLREALLLLGRPGRRAPRCDDAYILENPVRAGLCPDPATGSGAAAASPKRLRSTDSALSGAALSRGLSLGRGCRTGADPRGATRPVEQHDVDLARAVHATASFCSMSALRLGPVTIASALGRSSPTALRRARRARAGSDPRPAA